MDPYPQEHQEVLGFDELVHLSQRLSVEVRWEPQNLRKLCYFRVSLLLELACLTFQSQVYQKQ